MTRLSQWLHRSIWRPITIVFVLIMVLVGGAFDFAASQREAQCRSNNRTTSIVKTLVAVTFDDGTPTPDPDAPALSEEDQRALIVLRLANTPTYQSLDAHDRELVVDFLVILTGLSGGGGGGAEERLTALADSLQLDDCQGSLIF